MSPSLFETPSRPDPGPSLFCEVDYNGLETRMFAALRQSRKSVRRALGEPMDHSHHRPASKRLPR